MPSSEKNESLYRKLSFGLFCLFVLIAFGTISDYGMGWDEVTRWNSGDAKVAYYQELIGAEDKKAVVQNVPNDAYPGFFDMTLSWLHGSTGWDRFTLGHWLAFTFGLVGLVALWRIGVIFGGARLGFWAAVLMIVTPSFYGHWFHNPKDIPFTTTYTFGIWALVECFRRYPVFKKRWFFVAAVSCGLCMATRIAGMVLLAYLLFGVAAASTVYLWQHRADLDFKKTLRSLWLWWLAVPLVAAVAYVAMLPWWPASHKNLLSVSGGTLQQLHVRASEIPLFFRGEIMQAADAPHLYALWMFVIKAPECWLIGLLGALFFAIGCIRQRLGKGELSPMDPALSILLLGGGFPLLYLTCTAPALHNGVRHFLFAFPALALCAAWGFLQLGVWLRAYRSSMWRFGQVVFAVLLLLPIWHLIQLHPYQYIYFNALAGGPSGAYGRYEGEYWFTSSKHAVEQLDAYLQSTPEAKPAGRATRIFILGPWQVAQPFLPDGCELTSDASAADFLILNTQMLMHTRFEGDEVFRIERMGAPICVVLANEVGEPGSTYRKAEKLHQN